MTQKIFKHCQNLAQSLTPRKVFVLALITLGVTAGITLTSAKISQAQITKTARIVLDEDHKVFHIGPQIYKTMDPDKRLTYQVIVTRHENNLRGTRLDKNLVNLGLAAAPTWMVFSVTNNTSSEDWVLHFGKALDGRQALAHKLLVRNHTTGETFTRSLREDQDEAEKDMAGENMQGPALPIKVGKGQTNLFVMYIEAEGGLPNTIKPFLMTSRDYINMLRYGDLLSVFTGIFFISMMGFFIAVSFMQQNPHYLLFVGYYLINSALFFLINNSFFAPFTLMGEFLFLLYAASVIMGLIITKFFLDITIENHTENSFLFGVGAFIGFTTLFNMFLFGENTVLDDLLIFLPTSLTMLVIAGLSFLQAQYGKFAGHYYASAWLAVFIGSLITALSAASILSTNTLLMNAYWISLIPQAVFFVYGTNKKVQMTEQQQRHLRSRENRAAYSLARLQQSKESADQARLLRVIERERELMAELREREMQRTEEMRRAKDMADEANRAKSAFLAVVSHEIRTPMTGILGMVRLLIDTKLSKEQMDFAGAIQNSGDTMMALLNDILDFEKIESGNMELEDIEFDFPRLVQDVITLMSGHAADKNIELKSDIPESFPHALIGDPTRLRQIVLNLASNAIKFTQDGAVTIHLRATKLDGEQQGINADYEIYVAVEDTGIGIPEDVQENLFSPFAQADKTVSRKYGGTGLGLAIVKRLVEAMGSSVRVTSQEDEGSTFFFSILMNEGYSSMEEGEALQEAESIELPPMHILVIEDNEMNRRVIQGFLENAGHKAALYATGEDGIEALQKGGFDAVFSDISLSGMSGLETTRTIRTLPDRKLANIPIIAITGNVSSEDVEDYYKGGMNGFIPKPIDPEKINEVLAQIHTGALENPVPITPQTSQPIDVSQKEIPADAPAPKAETQTQEPAEPSEAPILMPDQTQQEDVTAAPVHEAPEPEPDTETQADQEEDNVPFGAENEVAPIQRFVQEQALQAEQSAAQEMPPAPQTEEAEDFDSFADASDSDDAAPPAQNLENTGPVFDRAMLDTLLSSLGQDQFNELIQGFMDTADTIIQAVPELKEQQNLEETLNRAHELKGMAANFGMTELSVIAGHAERAAGDGNLEHALVEMEKLPDANQRAKHAIAEWLKSKG